LFLILEQFTTEFGQGLCRIAKSMGIETMCFTAAELASKATIGLYLSNYGSEFSMRIHDRRIESGQLLGTYCSLNFFDAALWSHFEAGDADYAARETSALWLAILSSLKCPVINPPAMDTLGGTVLSPVEFLDLARRHGFQIPALVTVESGAVASELEGAGACITFTDLGEELECEREMGRDAILSPASVGNCFRIREYAPGDPVWITVVGDTFFAVMGGAGEATAVSPMVNVPDLIRERLKALQLVQNLRLAEYRLSLTSDGVWVMNGIERQPLMCLRVHGDRVLASVVTAATMAAS